MNYELQALSDELDEQNTALEAMLADMEYDDLAMEGSIDDLDEFLDDDEMEPAEESLFHKPKSVEKMLSIVQKRVRKKCKTVEACDDMLATLNQESQKFNDAMKQLKQAAIQYGEDGDKKALSHTVKPIVSGLKKSCDLLKLSDIADNAKNITDDDLQKLHDFISGATKIVKDHKASLSNAKEGYLMYETTPSLYYALEGFQTYDYSYALEATTKKGEGLLHRIKQTFISWVDKLIDWANGKNKKNKNHPKLQSLFTKFRNFVMGVKQEAKNPGTTTQKVNELQSKTKEAQETVKVEEQKIIKQEESSKEGDSSAQPSKIIGQSSPVSKGKSSGIVSSNDGPIENDDFDDYPDVDASSTPSTVSAKPDSKISDNDVKNIMNNKNAQKVNIKPDYFSNNEWKNYCRLIRKGRRMTLSNNDNRHLNRLKRKIPQGETPTVESFLSNAMLNYICDKFDSETFYANESFAYDEVAELEISASEAYVDFVETYCECVMEAYENEIGGYDMDYELYALEGEGSEGENVAETVNDKKGNIFKTGWNWLKQAIAKLKSKIASLFKKKAADPSSKKGLHKMATELDNCLTRLGKCKDPDEAQSIADKVQSIAMSVQNTANKIVSSAPAPESFNLMYSLNRYDVAFESAMAGFNAAMENYYEMAYAMEASVFGTNMKRGRRLRFGEESRGARKTYSAAKKAERKKDYEKAISLYQQAKKMFQALANKAKSFPDNVGYTRDTRYKDQSGGKSSALDWCLGMINMCEDAIDRINNKRMRGERRASEKAARAERKAAKRAAKESYGYNEYLDDDDDFYAMESDYDNDYDDFDDDSAMESGLYDADFYMDGFDPDEF